MFRRRVCDSCHSRKVRCDRNEPCGNCLDQNSTCTRTRGMKRLPKRDLSRMQMQSRVRELSSQRQLTPAVPGPSTVYRRKSMSLSSQKPIDSEHEQDGYPNVFPDLDDGFFAEIFSDAQLGDSQFMLLDLEMSYELMAILPLTDAQMINRRQLEHSQGLTWNRRQALESALSVASQILGSMEQGVEMTGEAAAASEGEDRNIPSAEFLRWMLNDIGSDKFGAFISDYFRHVGKQTLKRMGLSILYNNTATPAESILHTVCVNSIAFKFLTATLGTDAGQEDQDDELTQRLYHNALRYRETAKAALKKIPLTTRPSFSLLQAVLCGIFLHQGSGDTNTCRELARTACRICMDIGLHPGATDLRNVSEEEYYCFMWCYILDRNYAWKFGSPRVLTVELEAVIEPPTANIAASELILVYLDLAKVQDAMIPYMNDSTKSSGNAFQLHGVGTHLLREMQLVRGRIDQMRDPSVSWTSLDMESELASLDFAYHSIMTSILHLRQIALGQAAITVDNYLDSARRGLQALLSLCSSGDGQKTVAYLHWTLLYFPVTTYFALFCNAIATCHSGDFQMLIAVSNCLAQSGTLSAPVAAMQSLLQEFVSLSRRFFSTDGGGGSGDGDSLGSGLGMPWSMPMSMPMPMPMVPALMDSARSQSGSQDTIIATCSSGETFEPVSVSVAVPPPAASFTFPALGDFLHAGDLGEGRGADWV